MLHDLLSTLLLLIFLSCCFPLFWPSLAPDCDHDHHSQGVSVTIHTSVSPLFPIESPSQSLNQASGISLRLGLPVLLALFHFWQVLGITVTAIHILMWSARNTVTFVKKGKWSLLSDPHWWVTRPTFMFSFVVYSLSGVLSGSCPSSVLLCIFLHTKFQLKTLSPFPMKGSTMFKKCFNMTKELNYPFLSESKTPL